MSEANIARLVDKLSQMRGAALKMGQFMSIQDAHALPEQLELVLRKVQNMAHYMPGWQMEVNITFKHTTLSYIMILGCDGEGARPGLANPLCII